MVYDKINNKKGSVLLLVVFLLFFIALFVVGISNLATTDLQIAQNDKFSTLAFYVAEAGIERAIYELKQNNNWSAGFNQVQFPIGEDSVYTVTVDRSNPNFITLNSLGVVQDVYKRRILLKIVALPSSAPFPVNIYDWREAAP